MDNSLYKSGKYILSWQGKNQYGHVDASVPKDYKAGNKVKAFYRGQPYIVEVPDGLTEGDAFTVKVDLTNKYPNKIYKAKIAQIGQPFEYIPPAPYREGIA